MEVIVTLEPKVIWSSRYIGWFPISCFIFDIVTEKMDEVLDHIVIQEGHYSPKLITCVSWFRLIQSILNSKNCLPMHFLSFVAFCVSRLFTF